MDFFFANSSSKPKPYYLQQPAPLTYDQQQLRRKEEEAKRNSSFFASSFSSTNMSVSNGPQQSGGSGAGSAGSTSSTGSTVPVVSKAHWKPDALAIRCPAPSCPVVFSLLERKHHCRKCGDIFCDKHCQFEIRLSGASPPQHDPERGALSQVCFRCYEARECYQQRPGAAKSRTSEFMRERRTAIHAYHTTCDQQLNVLEQLALMKLNKAGDIDKEQPLILKWKEDSSVAKCPFCSEAFGTFFNRKHHCRLCGRIMCTNKTCSRDVVHELNILLSTADQRRVDRALVLSLYPAGGPATIALELKTCGECMWYMDLRRRRIAWADGMTIAEHLPILDAYKELNVRKFRLEQLLFEWNELEAEVASPSSLSPEALSASKKQLRMKILSAFHEFQDQADAIKGLPVNNKTEQRLQDTIHLEAIDFLKKRKFAFAKGEASMM